MTTVHAPNPFAAAKKAVNVMYRRSGTPKTKARTVYVVYSDNGSKIGKYKVWGRKHRPEMVKHDGEKVRYGFTMQGDVIEAPHYESGLHLNNHKRMTEALRRRK